MLDLDSYARDTWARFLEGAPADPLAILSREVAPPSAPDSSAAVSVRSSRDDKELCL
jgi:hypothetical protein